MSALPGQSEFLYDDFVLHITPEKFFVEPLMDPSNVMVIDRISYDIRLDKGVSIPEIASRQRICGVLGTVRLVAGPYLVMATARTRVGTINSCSIWRLEGAELLPYCRTHAHISEQQIQANAEYVSMLEGVLRTPYFYFSYTYDLTHSVQRLHNTTPQFLQMSYHERADQRFMWNAHLLRELAAHRELRHFCLPLVHGFVSIQTCPVSVSGGGGGRAFNWCLVSRRCCRRAGTRLFTRGIDCEGNVANMVETEQIIEFEGDRCSFVQTRGSIPLYWSQYPNLYYKPKPLLWRHLSQTSAVDEHELEALSLHFNNQQLSYGRQVVVNLIDHRGAEQLLEQRLASGCRQLAATAGGGGVRYESFDFHHECRKMRWHRLDILLERIAADQEEMGYFLMRRDGVVVSSQSGVFRTNCIDCLDRTNVVQSMLAKRQLEKVLRQLHVLDNEEVATSFQQLFKHVWADHADVISLQYSGTPALKTDFTRTGKRSVAGALRDGYNSLRRYYMNNFTDGRRQDGMDLFLGHYVVEPGESVCPLISRGVLRPVDWKFATLLALLLCSLLMFLSTLYVPSEYTVETLLYLIFWGVMVYGTAAVILIYGDDFVQKPLLCPPPPPIATMAAPPDAAKNTHANQPYTVTL